MFENEGLTALMVGVWVIALVGLFVAYLNHKGHQRDRERARETDHGASSTPKGR